MKVYKNLKQVVKFCSNSNNKAEKQLFETITILIKLKFTRNGFWPVFTETKPQIDQKELKKIAKPKNAFFWKQFYFKIITDIGLQQNRLLKCNTSKSQLGLLLMRLSHKTAKKTQKSELQKQLYDTTVLKAIYL